MILYFHISINHINQSYQSDLPKQYIQKYNIKISLFIIVFFIDYLYEIIYSCSVDLFDIHPYIQSYYPIYLYLRFGNDLFYSMLRYLLCILHLLSFGSWNLNDVQSSMFLCRILLSRCLLASQIFHHMLLILGWNFINISVLLRKLGVVVVALIT